jgi:hypothetical protein
MVRKSGGDRKKLANPTPDMLPPKIYENQATVYPVRVEQ